MWKKNNTDYSFFLLFHYLSVWLYQQPFIFEYEMFPHTKETQKAVNTLSKTFNIVHLCPHWIDECFSFYLFIHMLESPLFHQWHTISSSTPNTLNPQIIPLFKGQEIEKKFQVAIWRLSKKKRWLTS